jgi:hypothetical protein
MWTCLCCMYCPRFFFFMVWVCSFACMCFLYHSDAYGQSEQRLHSKCRTSRTLPSGSGHSLWIIPSRCARNTPPLDHWCKLSLQQTFACCSKLSLQQPCDRFSATASYHECLARFKLRCFTVVDFGFLLSSRTLTQSPLTPQLWAELWGKLSCR